MDHCCNDSGTDFKTYKISDLMRHMETDCPKKRKVCPNCREEFKSELDCYNHIKKDCEVVAV